MVIIREGCGKIGGSKSINLDIENKLPWYLLTSEGFKRFCESYGKRPKSLILRVKKRVFEKIFYLI